MRPRRNRRIKAIRLAADDVYVVTKGFARSRVLRIRPSARNVRLLFFSHKPPRATEAELEAIRARAKQVHAIIGNKQLDLVDLFSLVGEGEITPRQGSSPKAMSD